MMSCSSRRGSALLIVLGMLAFMIVSAVAFSAYMRLARLPSSTLRRTSASRQLVKAALARAIDQIDLAVGNNLYPGLGTEQVGAYRQNYWKSHIFIGTNSYVSTDLTVPVLTLEGLAYIPPALVNEARYYSRRSPAAMWKSFGFDAGRYAFCAIDVSDCFDINRLTADRARSSSDPARISLSYLFEDYHHTSTAGSGAEAWDTWFENFRTLDEDTLTYSYGSKVPLVSMADFNLALGAKGSVGSFVSPFYKYITSGGGTGFNTFGGEEEEDLVRRMKFVTDSWFPPAKDEETSEDYPEYYDLTTSDGQPFNYQFLNAGGGPGGVGGTSILNIMANGDKGKVRLLDSMPILGLVALYDYLDMNRVPVSLAVPTLERVPMVCGLQPNFNSAQFATRAPEEGPVVDNPDNGAEVNNTTKTTATREVYQKVSYYLDAMPLTAGLMGGVRTLFTYPFAHKDEINDTFTVEGRAALFFTDANDPMKMRTFNDKDVLHLTSGFANETPGLKNTGVIHLPFVQTSPSFGASVPQQEEDAIYELPIMTGAGAQACAPTLSQTPLMTLTYKWTQTWVDNGFGNGSYQPETRPNNATIERAHCGIPPLNKNGTPHPDYQNDANFLNVVNAGNRRVNLNVALWVRIKNSQGKTVDLVPAHFSDDMTFNQVNNMQMGPAANTVTGSAYPVMRFDTGVWYDVSPQGMDDAKTPKSFELSPKAVMVDDPRFNHAPESWYGTEEVTKAIWLENNHSSERNGDIFLATSDQAYLQSIYELAFLPRFSNLESVGANGPILGDYQNPDDGRNSFGTQNNARNENMMWRSYRLYGDGYDDFEGLGFTSAGRGFKVNPYTDSTNILLAAFANTPVNWRMASTNNQEVSLEEMPVAEFNNRFAWNEYSNAQDSRFKWTDLEGIAGAFMHSICPNRQGIEIDDTPQDQNVTNWKDAWRNLWNNADSDPSQFGNYTLQNTDLWSVDRKFLYGFWSDCFASKQQLYLVFVRAEPLMMGGGAMSRIPPQLGARAVALVWRDPTKTTVSGGNNQQNSGYPHRTRVLFYKQLD